MTQTNKTKGYIVMIEDYGFDFDLSGMSKDINVMNEFSWSYCQENVLDSGFFDFVFKGVDRKTINRFVKYLCEKTGLEKSEIDVSRIIGKV